MSAPPAAPVIAVASDHGGFALKQAIVRHLTGKGVAVKDVGTHSTEACDYPVFARAAAEAVARGEATAGVIVDGAGIGSSMVANKIPGVRAAMAFDLATANNAREHNDANVLTLGAGYLAEDLALRIVDVFLSTQCTVDRHKRRVADDRRARPGAPPSGGRPDPDPAHGPGLDEPAVSRGRHRPRADREPVAPGRRRRPGGASCASCTACGNCVAKRADTVRAILDRHPGARVTAGLGVGQVPTDLAKLIDHTLLKPDATYAQIDTLCDEALKFGFASVCVNPVHVRRCAAGSAARPCSCARSSASRSAPRPPRARRSRGDAPSATARASSTWSSTSAPSSPATTAPSTTTSGSCREVAREGGVLLKVIIETALLTDEEKVAACVAAKKARAHFVKTSTGFAKGGATVHDVALMAEAVDHKLGVKASGGVGSAADARKMVLAGATRIGASVGVKIVREAAASSSSAGGKPAGY